MVASRRAGATARRDRLGWKDRGLGDQAKLLMWHAGLRLSAAGRRAMQPAPTPAFRLTAKHFPPRVLVRPGGGLVLGGVDLLRLVGACVFAFLAPAGGGFLAHQHARSNVERLRREALRCELADICQTDAVAAAEPFKRERIGFDVDRVASDAATLALIALSAAMSLAAGGPRGCAVEPSGADACVAHHHSRMHRVRAL